MTLKDLLDLKNITINELPKRFDEIAKLLFLEYQIRKGENQYSFLEIEFYYYTEGHADVITYPRTTPSGKWFFHASGVDITFESDETAGFGGGILIRSLLKNDETVISGPLKCSWELFDFFDIFETKKEEFPLFLKTDKKSDVLFKTQRWIPYKEENAKKRFGDKFADFKGFLDTEYRFFVKHPQWDSPQSVKYQAKPWGKGSVEKEV